MFILKVILFPVNGRTVDACYDEDNRCVRGRISIDEEEILRDQREKEDLEQWIRKRDAAGTRKKRRNQEV